MSVEQVARDFVATMNDPEKLKGLIAADAVATYAADGPRLQSGPQSIPAMEALQMLGALATAMPDLAYHIQQVTVIGNQATVSARWSGTQSGPLSLPIPGIPTIAPTGKKVSVKDVYVLTVQGDKVSHVHFDTPADGGIPAALAQLAV